VSSALTGGQMIHPRRPVLRTRKRCPPRVRLPHRQAPALGSPGGAHALFFECRHDRRRTDPQDLCRIADAVVIECHVDHLPFHLRLPVGVVIRSKKILRAQHTLLHRYRCSPFACRPYFTTSLLPHSGHCTSTTAPVSPC